MATAAAAPAAAAASWLTKQLPGNPARAGRVLLYDGVCNICNRGIQFVAKRDPDRNVMFCSIQSQAAEPYLHALGLTRQDALHSLVFVEYKDCSRGSAAALRVTRYLRQPWPMLQTLLAVPEPIREPLYGALATYRYRVFGRSRLCQVPPVGLLDRFVDRDELMSGRCSSEGMAEDRD